MEKIFICCKCGKALTVAEIEGLVDICNSCVRKETVLSSICKKCGNDLGNVDKNGLCYSCRINDMKTHKYCFRCGAEMDSSKAGENICDVCKNSNSNYLINNEEFLKDNKTEEQIPKGWQCPLCGTVYAPWINECKCQYKSLFASGCSSTVYQPIHSHPCKCEKPNNCTDPKL